MWSIYRFFLSESKHIEWSQKFFFLLLLLDQHTLELPTLLEVFIGSKLWWIQKVLDENVSGDDHN